VSNSRLRYPLYVQILARLRSLRAVVDKGHHVRESQELCDLNGGSLAGSRISPCDQKDPHDWPVSMESSPSQPSLAAAVNPRTISAVFRHHLDGVKVTLICSRDQQSLSGGACPVDGYASFNRLPERARFAPTDKVENLA
jgi:hypothetical protein